MSAILYKNRSQSSGRKFMLCFCAKHCRHTVEDECQALGTIWVVVKNPNWWPRTYEQFDWVGGWEFKTCQQSFCRDAEIKHWLLCVKAQGISWDQILEVSMTLIQYVCHTI